MAVAARTSIRDILMQAGYALIGRKTRSLLTAAGIGLGIAATVATVEITATASGAISDKFDATRATRVTLRWPDGTPRPDANVMAGVTRLNGVVAAGLLCEAARDEHQVTGVSLRHVSGASTRTKLIAAQPTALTALHVQVIQGRVFDEGHSARGEQVALVDSVTASDLGISHPGQLIYLDDQPVSVFGIYLAPTGEARLTAAIIVPYAKCLHDKDSQPVFRQPEAVVNTSLGAADQVAAEARLAIHPSDPNAVLALVPPDLRTFRQGVESDTRGLFFGLALVSLIIAMLGVSNTTLVSVLERRQEIGLRRAIGATRKTIAAQFLIESGLTGLAGGFIGTVVAVNVTVAVALSKGWLVVLEPSVLGLAPALGLAVGTVAGVYPAWKASKIAPAASLRSS